MQIVRNILLKEIKITWFIHKGEYFLFHKN